MKCANLPLKFFYAPNLDPFGDGPQYASDFQALCMIGCDHTDVLVS